MRLTTRSAAGRVALLAVLLATPLAAAQPPADRPIAANLVAQGASFQGGADQSGRLVFLSVVAPPASAAPRLQATGHHIQARQFDNDGYELQTADLGGPAFDTLRALNFLTGNPYKQSGLDAARLDLTGSPNGYEVHLMAAAGVPMAGHFEQGRQSMLRRPELSVHGVGEQGDRGTGVPLAPTPSPTDTGAESGFWSDQSAGDAHVLTEASAGRLHLEGTFTLEVLGLDFHLSGDGPAADLHSGTTRDGLAPVAVGPLDSHLRAIHQSFLRIIVTDGTLDLGVPAARALQWSGLASDTATGPFRLANATGSVELASGQQQRLTGATYQMDGRYDLQANPSQQGLQLAVTGLDEAGQPLLPATQTVRIAASPIYWVAAAAVAGSAGITLLILALRRRQPTMADVESALEAGHFRRAARDAARLLRRRPGFEDAVLSRAIALSKLGRNQRVVREIQAHFATAEPSDGVLHYVLGLALKETGAPADAQAAWREALRRTPGLLPQVQPLLSGQQASSPPSAVAPLVDGTAYA
jgi:hypothetical protein